MNIRRKLLLITTMCVVLMTFATCDEDDEDTSTVGNWVRTTPYKGARRAGTASFTIGDVAYVGLGYNGDKYFSDFYAFDSEQGFWKTITPFPGVLREYAVAFSIGSKGYVGLGYNVDEYDEELADFWEYDPATDVWTQLDDFDGGARYNAVAFSIGGNGYVGTGNDGENNLGDFWKYNPGDDSWQEIISYPGQKREEALAFVFENKAYICTGRNNGSTDTEFWQFDPESLSWTNLRPDDDESYYDDFTAAVKRTGAVAVAYNNKIYIAAGLGSSGTVDNRVYEYDPYTQVWDQKTSFEGSGRTFATAYVIGNQFYLGTGQSGSSRFDDFWIFNPTQEYDEND